MYKSLLIAATTLAMLAAPTFADEAENMIKYRQAIMKAIGGHSGASSQIVRGKVDAWDDLATHANALAALNADLVRLFPEGSDFGETRAKEAVWADPDKFARVANDARDATAAFAKAVKAGKREEVAEAFKAVGQACKGCHQDFRQKDD